MHQLNLLLLLTFATLTGGLRVVAADDRGGAEKGFVSLFTGKDLSGWVVMGKKEGWQVIDGGVIRSEGGKGGNWLRSNRKYKDFVFKVEWRVSKDGNSGVFIRSAEKGAPWTTGYEVQISNAPRDDAHCTGSLYGYFPVKPRPDETHDKWHTFEIHCRGSRIEVLADGVKCIDADQSKNDKTRNKPLEGYIGLQDSHSPAGHYIEYRNARIKVLRSAIAADVDQPFFDLGAPRSKKITIPTIDFSNEKARHVIIAAGTEETYQGHATTLLMPDGKTIFCTWTYGHGGGCGPLKRSDDGGRTWSDLLPVPESWRRVRNCPSIHRFIDRAGTERLITFAGNGPMYQSISEDGGKTWNEMTENGLGSVVAPQTVLAVDGGKTYRMWVHRGKNNQDRPPLKIWQSDSDDGGLTWKNERMICYVKGANPCEPAVIRSPDGKQMLMLMRENARRYNSLMMTSDDEGATWSAPREAPPSLTGDRHRPRYLPDGRLMMVFRDTNNESPDRGHFVGWVGRYEDIVEGRQGQYRVKLLHSNAGGDCGYGCLERLPDGTMVAATYVKYAPGPRKHSVVSVRFKIEELDAKFEFGDFAETKSAKLESVQEE